MRNAELIRSDLARRRGFGAETSTRTFWLTGAGEGIRTLDPNLGKKPVRGFAAILQWLSRSVLHPFMFRISIEAKFPDFFGSILNDDLTVFMSEFSIFIRFQVFLSNSGFRLYFFSEAA